MDFILQNVTDIFVLNYNSFFTFNYICSYVNINGIYKASIIRYVIYKVMHFFDAQLRQRQCISRQTNFTVKCVIKHHKLIESMQSLSPSDTWVYLNNPNYNDDYEKPCFMRKMVVSYKEVESTIAVHVLPDEFQNKERVKMSLFVVGC